MEEVFEALDFFGFAKGNAKFFKRENVAFAVVLVFFNKGFKHFLGDLGECLLEIFGLFFSHDNG